MFGGQPGYGQSQPKSDTLTLSDDSFKDIIFYSARDSIFTDIKNQRIHLYGDAKVRNSEINMAAGYILIDIKKNELLAQYSLDDKGNRVEFPIFNEGSIFKNLL
jgi:hypothetical protein